MSNTNTILLQIASNVEAAVKCYKSVETIADEPVWREHFYKERVSALCNWYFNSSPFDLEQEHEDHQGSQAYQ
jgi:hypothetical protein